MSLSRQEELEQYNAFEEIVADLKTRVSDGAGSHAFIGSSKSSKRDSPHVQQAMEDIDDYMRKSYPGSGPNNSWLTCWLHFLADACQLPVREHLRMAKSALQVSRIPLFHVEIDANAHGSRKTKSTMSVNSIMADATTSTQAGTR